MNKQAKRALNQMSEETKLEALITLLKSLESPHIFIFESEQHEFVGYNYSKNVTKFKFLNMMAGMLIKAAETNGTTPIKLLSDLGEMMSKIINETNDRTKANSP